jgi:thiol:disulfide interchange protein DsbA
MRKYWSAWVSALLAGLCLFSLPAAAQPVAGQDFSVIEPAQPTTDPARIEVVEFFSYACPHCNDLNPLIQKWAGNLPRDVLFTRVPVDFNPFYKLMARFFYTLDATGDLSRLDAAVFAAIHDRGLKLVSEKSITEWAVSQGIDARRFSEAWNSFSVDARMKRADLMAQNHGIRSVPALVVDGRYLVNGKSSLQGLLDQTDQVVAMRRDERNGKPAR